MKTVRTVTVCVEDPVKSVNVAVDDVVATGVPVSNTYVYEITKATPVGDKDPAGIFAAGVHDTPNPVEVMELGTIAKPVGATETS